MTQYQYKTDPFNHQRKVLQLSWKRAYFGLFMEMGTAKTKVIIDTLAALWDAGQLKEALIFAPKSVVGNWFDELELHMPDRVPYWADWWVAGMGKRRTQDLEELLDAELAEDTGYFRIALMGIEGIHTDSAFGYAKRFLKSSETGALICIDESTTIKNPKRTAKRSKAARKLAKMARFRRIMTGQPVPQGPLDIWAQCEFLKPGVLGYPTFTGFKARYAIIKQEKRLNDEGEKVGKPFDIIMGYRNLSELKRRMRPFTFHIAKSECLDLPPKLYKRFNVPLTAEQAKHYKTMKTEALAEFEDGSISTALQKIAVYTRLHQITCGYLPDDEGKLHSIACDRLRVLTDDILPNALGNTIIWTHFTDSILLISRDLRKRFGSDAVGTFYGATKTDDRQQLCRDFQDPDHPLRYLIANKTMARGVTLTAATDMIYYTNQWDLEIRQQSEDRAHRAGLKHAVTYTDLVSPGTIDLKILRALRTKADLAAYLMSADPEEAI